MENFSDELINEISKRVADIIISKQNKEVDEVDDLIDVNETAKILQVTKVSIWRWEKAKKIQPYFLGGKKFFKKSEILKSIIKK